MAHKIEIGALTSIPLQSIPTKIRDSVLKRVTSGLTHKLKSGADAYGGAGQGSSITVQNYYLDENYIEVPRYFFEKYGHLFRSDAAQVDKRVSGADVSWEFVSELRTDKGQEEAVSILAGTEGGILAAAPGKGKTVMALAALEKLRKRALVVVPTSVLQGQWIERIVEHTSLRKNMIGVVREKTCQWDRPVIVGMVQSLASVDYPEEFYDSIGVLITDEVHRMGAPTWLQVIPLFPAKVRWGLSATVERKDRMERAFQAHIGPVVHRMLESDLKPVVYMMHTKVSLVGSQYRNNWNDEINWGKLHTALSKQPQRNELLVRHLVKAWSADRKILALSRRVEHLENFREWLIAKGVPPAEVGLIAGSHNKKHEERLEVLSKCKIILAIEAVAGLGLDEPGLDTLFWLTPSQNVEQNIGRIIREYEHKKSPLVIDPVDDVTLLQDLARSREKAYGRHGFEFKHVQRE